MKNPNFDKEAMEQKIRDNQAKGFDIPGIKIALREELKATLQSIRIREARVVELEDQIEYMEERKT